MFPTLKLQFPSHPDKIRKESDADFEEAIRFVATLDGDGTRLSEQDYQLSTRLCESAQSSYFPLRCADKLEDRYCQAWTWKAQRVCATLKRYDINQEALWRLAGKYQEPESPPATGGSMWTLKDIFLIGLGSLVIIVGTGWLSMNGIPLSIQPQFQDI